ncbi:hypothetical protein ASPWEDRAFT_167435 [Aspergillus wentii DTO 134E9]|uniref:Clr5 domain-containing protein n=1 Tax=Aspergillus wentii DTO 134E9 TaxID=1073089 RepID=A0A1L9S2M9_ASPWE|nr:uncharacterized protein ASPWEDRAFT_167435 [Aspergillus wentii DTO 134E9]KAI9924457.1 hypothetical protein MW887_007084 [Aspergillus wentii]OJJ41415.1 hypothetical protein ASPWEDRAFT_167435 [Aspergillus wentii DTO 134E9]
MKSSPQSTKSPKSPKSPRKAVPRQHSDGAMDPRNFTSDHPDQKDWSWENLPDILYQLKPDKDQPKLPTPRVKSYTIDGRPLRDLPVLPDRISSVVEEFRVEAWQRLDRRVHLGDIVARMHKDFEINCNALQQRSVRFRQEFGLLTWGTGNKRSNDLENILMPKLHAAGVDLLANTTRGYTPGLINPVLGEAGGRIPVPEHWVNREGAKRKKSMYKSPKSCKKATMKAVEEHVDVTPSDDGTVENPESPESPEITEEPQTPETPEQEPVVFVHENFSVKELPENVCMQDLDLSLGITKPILRNPTARITKTAAAARALRRRAKHIVSSQSIMELCKKFSDTCEIIKIRPELPLIQLPTQDIYPQNKPFELDCSFSCGNRKEIFDNALNQYYGGMCSLVEMPLLEPTTILADVEMEVEYSSAQSFSGISLRE